VVMPVLKKWRILERGDFTGESARLRDEVGEHLVELEKACDKFEVSKQRYLEREAKRTERNTARKVLSTKGTLKMSGR